MRALRRLLLLAVVAIVATTLVRRRRPFPTGAAPTWPPLDVVLREPPSGDRIGEPADAVTMVIVEGVAVGATMAIGGDRPGTWALPVDGECPAGHPVKANPSSGIFHVPGGRSYARTKPERCYATPEDAEADGFRRAKL